MSDTQSKKTMKELIYNWLAKLTCNHKWYTYHKCNIYTSGEKHPVRIEHTLICEKCGKIKKLKM